MLTALVERNTRSGICFGGGDCSKETAGAAANDGDVFLKVCGVGRRGRHSELKALANGDVADNTRMSGVEVARFGSKRIRRQQCLMV